MRYGSRKFIFSLLQLGLMCGIPILFHYLGISDDLSKMVLIGIFSGHLYHFANIWDSKLNGDTSKQS